MAKAARYAQAEVLLTERNSQRSTVCATGVARMTIAKLIKKAVLALPQRPRRRPKKAQRRKPEALELDEMRTFVGGRKRKVWWWLVVERASRCSVAWGLGCRGAATARRLWSALPQRYWHHCRHRTDQWEAPRACPTTTTTGPTPKAAARPTLWRPSIAPYASAAAYWSANPAPSAKVYECIRHELRL